MKPINVPNIPVDIAKSRVARFRAEITEQIPAIKAPRAILIPINDLMAIVDKYSTVDENGNIRHTLKGVRAYFAVKRDEVASEDNVTALIVAVDKEGNDLINTTDGLAEEEDGSGIYDFTLPCPTECDVDSPLYIGIE
jgi:hypothetical protein